MRRLIVAIGKIVRQEAQAEAINAIVRTIDETLGGALLQQSRMNPGEIA